MNNFISKHPRPASKRRSFNKDGAILLLILTTAACISIYVMISIVEWFV